MMKLSAADLEMFARFRIPEETLEAAGIERVTDEEARELYGMTGDGSMRGIVFPYFIGTSRVTARLRRDAPEMENGKPKRKYVAPYGDKRHLYFPPGTEDYLADAKTEIVFVEAEKSALALLAWAARMGRKLLPVATGGCWGWRGKIGKTTAANGERVDEVGPLPQIEVAAGRTAYILFDANAKTNQQVQAARLAFAKALREVKAKANILSLPEGEWNGPDDYLAVHGDAELLAVFAKPAGLPDPLVVYDLREFKAAAFPPRETLVAIDDTPVFTARSLNQIFAWRGTGKTMVSMALAGAIATGGKFLNLEAKRPARVVYFEGETPNAQLQERAKLLVGPTEPGYFRLVSLESQVNGIASFSEAAGRGLADEAIGESEVVVFDSISTLAWIPTNEEEAWLDLLAWLARLRSRGLAILFLHHAGKGGLQRGHSRSEDMLDVSIKLTRAPEDEELEYLKIKFEYDKFRGERTGIRSLSVDYREGTWSYATLTEEKLKMLERYLTDNPGASATKIAKETGIASRPTITKMCRELEERYKKERRS